MTVTLITHTDSFARQLEVPLELAVKCRVIQGFLEEDPLCDTIPVPAVNHATLKGVFDILHRRKSKMQEIGGDNIDESSMNREQKNALAAWTKNEDFTQQLEVSVFDLLIASNYLGCEILIDALTDHIAKKVAGMSRDEMREYMGIENDFTPEEEATVLFENAWAAA